MRGRGLRGYEPYTTLLTTTVLQYPYNEKWKALVADGVVGDLSLIHI